MTITLRYMSFILLFLFIIKEFFFRSGLSRMQREVIKWTQSLDLSFPIKNPRKDLANGFLVAEILSRYDKEVSMHSFGTELAMNQRINNWQQISKILERLKCTTVTKELIAATVQQKGLSARDLLDQLYMFLTKRTLRPNVMAPPVATILEKTSFSRPTASTLLREANDATKSRMLQATGAVDEVKIRATNETVLQRHSIALQSLKLAEPDRYKPRKAGTYAEMHQHASTARDTSSRTISPSPPTKERSKYNIKEVEIRAVDDSILHTFAERDQKAKEDALRNGFPRDDDLSQALSRVVQKPLSNYGIVGDLDELFPQAREGCELLQKFVTLRHRIPVQVRATCWSELHSVAKNIAKHIVLRSGEYAHLVVQLSFAFGKDTALLPGLSAVARSAEGIADGSQQSTVYDIEQAFALLAAVGERLVALSPEAAANAAEVFLVPALVPLLLHGTAGVVACCAQVLTCYVHHHHLDGVRRLVTAVESALNHSAAADRSRFLLCTSHMLSQIDPCHCAGVEVVSRFYAAAGFGSSDIVSRGAAVVLAQVSASADPVEASVFLHTVLGLKHSASWELRLLALEFLLAFHRKITREDAKSRSTSRRRSLGDEELEALTTWEQRLEELSDQLPALRQEVVSLMSTFDGVKCSSQQRAAALILCASYLDNDVGSVDDIGSPLLTRVARYLSHAATPGHIHDFLDGDEYREGLATLAGRVKTKYVTSGLRRLWCTPSVSAALTNMLEVDGAGELTTLEIVLLVKALAQGASAELFHGDSGDESIMASLLHQARDVLLTAVTNPGQCRGVSDSQLPFCAHCSLDAAAKFYVELSGEVAAADACGDLADFHSRALAWLQASM